MTFSLEPLRRGDLLNAINKLAGDRGAQKHHHLLRRPHAITPYIRRTASAELLPGCTILHFDFPHYVQFSVDFSRQPS